MNGFLLINKEKDWTSRDVCNKVSHLLNTKKVGHIGTLDPFAEGLLIVMVGSATKTGFLFDDFNKTYQATLLLGKQTDTGDLLGKVINEKPVKKINNEEINMVFDGFLGNYSQIPPMTSAIHYHGQKLYKLAHQGKEVVREPRNVKISKLTIDKNDNDTIIFTSEVSKGTYIRTLGEDIAKKLDNVGHLIKLVRTAIGPISISDSRVIKVNEVSSEKIIPINELITFIPSYKVNGPVINMIKNGVTLSLNNVENCDKILLLDNNNNALAIYQNIGSAHYKCLRGLWN